MPHRLSTLINGHRELLKRPFPSALGFQRIPSYASSCRQFHQTTPRFVDPVAPTPEDFVYMALLK
jgi:hypothetical protein